MTPPNPIPRSMLVFRASAGFTAELQELAAIGPLKIPSLFSNLERTSSLFRFSAFELVVRLDIDDITEAEDETCDGILSLSYMKLESFYKMSIHKLL